MIKKWKLKKVYKITGYEDYSDKKVLRRLLEFGFVKGTNFVISYKSLLGDTFLVEVRGYTLSLRNKFLSYLKVE
jgi:Fe2+ transport system protein FeoA